MVHQGLGINLLSVTGAVQTGVEAFEGDGYVGDSQTGINVAMWDICEM